MKFKITYTDPNTDEEVVEVQQFFSTGSGTVIDPHISALEWAEDYAYTAADKGPHSVEEVP